MAENDHTSGEAHEDKAYREELERRIAAVREACETIERLSRWRTSAMDEIRALQAENAALKAEAERRMRQLADIEEGLRTKLAAWRSRAQCMSCAEVLLGLRPSCRSHGETPRT